MKYIAWVGAVLVTLLVGLYIIIFTSFGNALLQPILEQKIAKEIQLDSKLSTFSLSMSQFSIVLELDKDNRVSLNGNYSLISKTFNIAYRVKMDRLESLKSLTKSPLRGAFKTTGKVAGDMEFMKIDGESDIAKSKTSYHIELTDLNPTSIIAKVKEADLATLLYMGAENAYANALFDLDIDIADARASKLKGKISSNIKSGLVDAAYITKAYKFNSKMPRTTFNAKTTTILSGDILDTNIDFKSTLGDLKIKSAKVNLKDGLFVSDYRSSIKDLNKLFFVTDRHLRGSIVLNGEIKKAEDLDFTMYTNVADGAIEVKLHNSDFQAEFKKVQTLKILNMLLYPELFESHLDGKLVYNLERDKGKFDGYLVDGKFTKNQVFSLIKKHTQVDLYVERFKGAINADIDKENILATLNLNSNTSAIISKKTVLNSKTKKIDSKLEVVVNKSPVDIRLRGDVNSPKVEVDLKKFIKSEAGKTIQKEALKLFKRLF